MTLLEQSNSQTAEREPVLRESSLLPKYLELIRSGRKTVEGRIRTGKWSDVITGDRFRFESSDPSAGLLPVLCRVTSVRPYDSFRSMLEAEGVDRCLPGITDMDEAVEVYRSIPGYREREAVDGVVGVGVQVEAEQATA